MRRFLGLRWLTIALIMLGALVNFLSRQTLSIAAPTVIASTVSAHSPPCIQLLIVILPDRDFIAVVLS